MDTILEGADIDLLAYPWICTEIKAGWSKFECAWRPTPPTEEAHGRAVERLFLKKG
jgi:hypothetical protein